MAAFESSLPHAPDRKRATIESDENQLYGPASRLSLLRKFEMKTTGQRRFDCKR